MIISRILWVISISLLFDQCYFLKYVLGGCAVCPEYAGVTLEVRGSYLKAFCYFPSWTVLNIECKLETWSCKTQNTVLRVNCIFVFHFALNAHTDIRMQRENKGLEKSSSLSLVANQIRCIVSRLFRPKIKRHSSIENIRDHFKNIILRLFCIFKKIALKSSSIFCIFWIHGLK